MNNTEQFDSESKLGFYKSLLLIGGLTILAWYIYSPGLSGGFIFDDYHSLKKLSVFQGEITVENLMAYLGLSDTGILKRPISVLSFLIDAQNWPADPYSFKRTNLILHLFNGVILFYLLRMIFGNHSSHNSHRNMIAITATSLWLLHPFFVSTTLYIVQRMAMLPVTFMLLGLFAFVFFRFREAKESGGFNKFMLLSSVYGATFLAVFSKENGVLVLPLMFLFEVFIIQKYLKIKPLQKKFNAMLLVLPTMIIAAAFVYMTVVRMENYDVRPFTPVERILTEFRVVADYIYHLLAPKYFTYGVFADGFAVSKSLFNPITTVISAVFIVMLLSLAWVFRNRFVWLSFSIFFFFVALSLESTLIPLELYYEHRTYLAALFLGVPIALMMVRLLKFSQIYYLIPIAVIGFLAFMTTLRVQVWKDNFKLHEMTMEKYPESERAITMTADYYARNGFKIKTMELLDQAILQHNSLALHFNRLQYLCGQEGTDYYLLNKYFESTLKAFKTEAFNMSSMSAFTSIFRKLLRNECKTGNDMEYATELYESLFLHKHKNRQYAKLFQAAYGMHYYFETNELEKGVVEIKKLINTYHRYYDVFEGLDVLYAKGEFELINQLLIELREDYKRSTGLLPDLKGWGDRIEKYQQLINEQK